MPSPSREPGFSSFGRQEAGASADSRSRPSEDIGEVVDRLRSQVQNLQRDLSFSVDDSSGEVVVRVVDGESGKVLRQIPSEELLRLAERLDEMRSLLFEGKA
ncbi:flagellar biosynthesis protein FlaG [Pseudomonas sp. TTU2014-105ASC]|nr:flagellar biosynthesis protein FlaG [Pseudomonas sp. TTU2014-105ASC]